MTATQFVYMLRDLARAQARPVFAIDFEPCKDGVKLTARFKEPCPRSNI